MSVVGVSLYSMVCSGSARSSILGLEDRQHCADVLPVFAAWIFFCFQYSVIQWI